MHTHTKREPLNLICIVNGEDVRVETHDEMPLHEARQQALQRSQNLARPGTDWEIRDSHGQSLDPMSRICDYRSIRDAGRIFLTLRTGAGG